MIKPNQKFNLSPLQIMLSEALDYHFQHYNCDGVLIYDHCQFDNILPIAIFKCKKCKEEIAVFKLQL